VALCPLASLPFDTPVHARRPWPWRSRVGDASNETTKEKKWITPEPAYGLWSLVIINSLVFMIFAFILQTPIVT
jgi:hypothetical protein